MAVHKKTFWEKIQYIFAPDDAKGVGFADRLSLTGLMGVEEAWAARPDVPREKQLIDMLVGLAPRMGIASPPQLIVYNSSTPNAGSVIFSGNIAVSTNLLDIMTPPQLEAVLGHELSHHKHRGRDASVTFGVPLVYDVVHEAVHPTFGQRTRERKTSFAFAIADMIGLGVANVLLPLAWSRSVEYEADREGILATGHPQDMISALQKVDNRREKLNQHMAVTTGRPEASSQNPSLWKQLIQTHPPTALRIEQMKQMQEVLQQEQALPSGSVFR